MRSSVDVVSDESDGGGEGAGSAGIAISDSDSSVVGEVSGYEGYW